MAPQPHRRFATARGRHRWMYGFRLDHGPSLEQVVAEAYPNPERDEEACPHQ
jgi:hypothetical protein